MECSSVTGLQTRGGTTQAGRLSRHNKKELVGERKKKRQDFVFFFFLSVSTSPPFDPPTCCLPTSCTRDNSRDWRRKQVDCCIDCSGATKEKNENNFQVSPVQCVLQLLKISRRVTVKRIESDSLKLSIGMCFFSFFKHIQHTITNQSESPEREEYRG